MATETERKSNGSVYRAVNQYNSVRCGGGNFAQIFELKQQATFGISLACRAVLHCEHFNLAAN